MQCRRLELQKVMKSLREIDGVEVELKCKVLNSSLGGTLGSLNYVLADKTGTLTQRAMKFNVMVIGRYTFFCMRPNAKDPRLTETDRALKDILLDQGNEGEKTRNAMRCMSLCHSVLFDSNVMRVSPSPEDLEFLEFCKIYDYVYQVPEQVDGVNYQVLSELGELKKYKLLERFDFTPERRRQSIIVSLADDSKKDEILMFTKGADETIRPLLNLAASGEAETVFEQIDKLSKKGYRVMMMAVRKLTQRRWEEFHKGYKALKEKSNDIEEIYKKQEEIESELELLGVLSFEERLQEKITDCIKFIRAAKVRTWVATGDKLNTSLSIAKQCGLILPNSMILKFSLPEQIKEDVFIEMDAKLRAMQKTQFACALIDGPYFSQIMEYKKTNVILYEEFVDIVMRCECAVFARTYPVQKEQIVQMIKRFSPKNKVLAIGDGYNDAYMLRAADVGVAIKDTDHSQISKISDVSIGDFKALVPLMFYFGRECYRRNAYMLRHQFMKGILLTFPVIWNGFLNFFSGFPLYESYAFEVYHFVFTSFPIFFYTLFDKVYSKSKLLFSPLLYKTGTDDYYFSKFMFLRMMIASLAVSLLMTSTALSLFDWGNYANGWSFGYFNYGNMVIYGAVVVMNLYVFAIANSYSITLFLIVFLSIGLFYGFWFWHSLVPTNDLYQTFWEVIFSIQFFLYNGMLVGMVVILYLGLRIEYFSKEKDYIPDFDIKFDANADNQAANAEAELAISGVSDNQDDNFVMAELQKKKARKSNMNRRRSTATSKDIGLLNDGEKPKYKPLGGKDDSDEEEPPTDKKMI